MSLVRFSNAWSSGDQKQTVTTLIRAAGILEYLIVDSPHNYQALLLLVRIYLLLGAGSLALKTFSRLSVKQLQYETVAHNLFTRLATIHPHSAPPIEGAETKDFDPQSAFTKALNFYRTADVSTLRNRSNGLEYGSYVNVIGCIDLQKKLNNSICRRMWALDIRRMQRLVGGNPTVRYEAIGQSTIFHEKKEVSFSLASLTCLVPIAQDASPLEDQRIFDAFMNCETPGKPTFEEQMRPGPLPKVSSSS